MIRATLERFTRWGLPALALSVAVMACDETSSPTDTGMDDGSDTGRLTAYLTDAPGDVDSVWVQIDDVVLSGGGEQISLLDEPTGLINLTQLRDSATAMAEGQEVDADRSFTQIRLILGGAVLQSTGEEVYTHGGAEHPHGMEGMGQLQCPGCGQSGFKVRFPGSVTVQAGEEAGVLIDFDVSRSFGRQAGRSGMWVMRPVLHATVSAPDDIESGEAAGEITGSVSLDGEVSIPACGVDENGDPVERTLEEFVPAATAISLTDDEGQPLEFTGETDDDGTFELEVLGADAYALSHRDETVFDSEKLVWEATADPSEVTIESEGDEVGDVSYTVTAVTCESTGDA